MIRAALVSIGGAAQIHARVLNQSADAHLVALASRDGARAADLARVMGAKTYDNVETMLDQEQPDAVWICVPPRFAITFQGMAVERGIPFITEKPVALDLAAAQQLSREIDRRQIVAAVAYNWRGLDFLPEIQARLAERPARLIVGQWLSSVPGVRWWRLREEGGGQTVEQATHLFDTARLLAGEATVLGAAAWQGRDNPLPDADIDDASVALLAFESGAIGMFGASSLLEHQHVIRLELISEGLGVSISLSGRWPLMIWTAELRDSKGSLVVENKRDPFEVEDQAFMKAVQEGNPALAMCSYAEGLRTLSLTLQVEASTRRTQPGVGR